MSEVLSERPSQCSEFADNYIDILRSYQPLVDIDVAPGYAGGTKHYDGPAEVRSDLEDLAASLPTDESDRELVEQKIGADIMLLRALDGEAIGFHEYVRGTVGITPEPIDEERVQSGIAMLDMLLRDRKLGYDAAYKDEFEQKYVIRDREAVRRNFEKSLGKVRRAARNLVGDPGGVVDLELVNKPKEYWTASLSKMVSRYRLTVNLVKPLTVDWIATTAAHEHGGHVLQLESWRQAAEAGDMNPVLAVTGAHTAYAVQAEGVSQTAEDLMLDDSSGNILSALHNECAGRVFHNVDYGINIGEDPKALARYAQERLPLMPPETLTAEALVARTHDPLYRAYLMAFAPSVDLLHPVRTMSPNRQKEVLKTLYERALTPDQIGRLVTRGQKVVT